MISDVKPLVSIGIPSYNRAGANLRKVIERALSQTYENVEVIVSDNCSTDHTADLVGSIEDSRLRYIRQQTNIGANNNFNYCLQQAKGDYFLLFHDDDMIDEDFIETCMSSHKNSQTVGAIFTGVRIIDEHGSVTEEHPNNAVDLSPVQFIQAWYQGDVALYLCSTLYNTEKLKEVGGFKSKKNLYDDLVPTFTLITKYGLAAISDIKASFRRHSGNRGATIPIGDWLEDSLYLLDVIDGQLPRERNTLRPVGQLYFCKKMYNKTANELAVSRSLLDYLQIYRSFNYIYSPLRFFYDRKLGRRVTRIKQLFGRKSNNT